MSFTVVESRFESFFFERPVAVLGAFFRAGDFFRAAFFVAFLAGFLEARPAFFRAGAFFFLLAEALRAATLIPLVTSSDCVQAHPIGW